MHGDGGVLDRHVARPLSHAEDEPLRLEPRDERIGRCGRERLEQLEARRAPLAHRLGDQAVVDRLVDPVVRSSVTDLQLEVEPEQLTVARLLGQNAVIREHLEAVQLDDHPATAFAAASASTCSRTSCTRRIAAPRS